MEYPKCTFKYCKLLFWLQLLLAAYFLFACSPVKRLDRLHKNHPYLFERKTDTILVKDTFDVMVPGIRADTIISYSQLWDTLYLDREHFHVKVVRIPYSDSIYIDGSCDTVLKTVYRELKVPYSKYEALIPERRNTMKTIFQIFFAFIVICILYVFYRYFQRE